MRPSPNPANTMPPMTTGVAVPRRVKSGTWLSYDQRVVPSALSSAISRPSLVWAITTPSSPVGGARTSLDNWARQRSEPSPASRAMTSPRVVPTRTLPSPAPTPPVRNDGSRRSQTLRNGRLSGSPTEAVQIRRPLNRSSATTVP